MSEPTKPDSLPFQSDILTAIQAECARSEDSFITLNHMAEVLTYHATQCLVKAYPTKKMAREMMKNLTDASVRRLTNDNPPPPDNAANN